MKHRHAKLKLLAILALVISTGCKTPLVQNNSADNLHGGNHVGLFLHYYSGIFGDDQPTWGGMWYSSQNLSVVAHLPTRSEFFIWVQKPQNGGNNATNIMQDIVKRIEQKSGVTGVEGNWEEITQNFGNGKKDVQQKRVNYYEVQFIGTRFDTDRYSKSDQVVTTIFIGCLTPEKPAPKALYSVVVAMIPVNVSEDERSYLLKVLNDFLREGVTYFHVDDGKTVRR